MGFRNHRQKIKAYRASGKMFGQTFATAESKQRSDKADALVGKQQASIVARQPGPDPEKVGQA